MGWASFLARESQTIWLCSDFMSSLSCREMQNHLKENLCGCRLHTHFWITKRKRERTVQVACQIQAGGKRDRNTTSTARSIPKVTDKHLPFNTSCSRPSFVGTVSVCLRSHGETGRVVSQSAALSLWFKWFTSTLPWPPVLFHVKYRCSAPKMGSKSWLLLCPSLWSTQCILLPP